MGGSPENTAPRLTEKSPFEGTSGSQTGQIRPQKSSLDPHGEGIGVASA